MDSRGPAWTRATHNWVTSLPNGLAKLCGAVAPRRANNITSWTCKAPAQDACRTSVNPREYTNDTQGAAWTCNGPTLKQLSHPPTLDFSRLLMESQRRAWTGGDHFTLRGSTHRLGFCLRVRQEAMWPNCVARVHAGPRGRAW